MVTKFETEGGTVSRGITYSKLLDHLREAEDCAYTLAHLHNTEGNDKDKLLANAWLLVGELFKQHRAKITQLAMGKLH
jgi:hypothetical protein